jgi:hypothetical protein
VGIKLPHLGLGLLEQVVFDSKYEFSMIYGVLFMAPVTGQPIVQGPSAVRTTTITDCADLGLTHRHEFSNWISLRLQLSKLPALE